MLFLGGELLLSLLEDYTPEKGAVVGVVLCLQFFPGMLAKRRGDGGHLLLLWSPSHFAEGGGQGDVRGKEGGYRVLGICGHTKPALTVTTTN